MSNDTLTWTERLCVYAPCSHCEAKNASHQGQQVEEQSRVFADQVVGLTAQVHEQLEATGGTLAAVDDVGHVRGQDEGGAVPVGGGRGTGVEM